MRNQIGLLNGSNASDAVARSAVDFALPVLLVAGIGAGATEVGILNAVGSIGFILFGIPLGFFADKSTTSCALGFSLALKLGALVALVAAVTFGWLSFPVILGIGALFGLGAVGAESAQVVAAGRLAGSDQVARVYARLQSVDSSAAIAVPVLAALILGWSSHVFAWSVLVLVLISLVLGLLIRTNPTGDEGASAEEQGKTKDSLGRGLREIWVNTPLRTITIITILTNFALATASAIESVLFLTHMGVSASVYAIFTGIAGFAALLGSLIATRIIDRLGKEKTVFFGYGLLAVAALVLIIPSVAPVAWGLVAAYVHAALWGVAMVVANIAMAGWSAELVPANILGRTSSAGRALSMGTIPFGSVLGGFLADQAGLPVVLVITAILTTAGFALTLTLINTKNP